jgi:hypothetical protein
MFKQILFHALVGGAIFVVGASLHDFADIKGPGNFLAYGGMAYAGVTTLLLLLGVNLPTPSALSSKLKDASSKLEGANKDREGKKARQELLEYKKLLDEGILTQEEFDLKASELKKKFI